MIPNEGFIFSGFCGRPWYRSVIRCIVLFQQGIQNVYIFIGVVGRDVLPHPCFQSSIRSFYFPRFTLAVGRIHVNIILL